MMFKKRCILSCVLVMICFALSGCFSAASNITINDDGSVKYEATMVGKDMVKNYIDEIKNEAKQKDDSVQIEPYQEGNMSGYKKTADYSSIEEFATSFSQDDNFKTTIKENKGWFFDAYNFTCIVKGNEEFEKEFGSDQESLMMAKAMMSDCKLGYTINLPYAADKTNADKITNENKTLYWDLASTATSANDKTLEAQFKLWHLEKVVATIVVIVVLVILAGIIYREARVSTNANEVKNKKMLAGGLLLTSLILIGASIYMINKTPTFTDNDIIGKKSVETSKDSGISKDMNKKIPEERSTNAEAVKAGQELKQKGINGEVVASSIGHNSNGYLSLIKDNNQYQIVTNDVKNGRIGITPYDKNTLYFTDKKPKPGQDERVIFNITILNDKTDKDSSAGVWENGNHNIPVFALYKFDNNGNLVPGMLTTGVGVKPSHYQGYFYESRNVETINLFLTEMMALQKNITDNQVKLP